MGKSYKVDFEDDVSPVDVYMKRREGRRPRDRWDDEFRQHEMSQTRDHRAALPITRYREKT